MRQRHDDGYYRAAAIWFQALDDGRKSDNYWARVFAVSPHVIAKWRTKPTNRYGVDPDVLARAAEMIQNGMSYKETARALGNISHMTLLRRIPKPITRTERDPWVWAKELLEDGCSYAETSRTTGIPNKELRETLPGFGWSIAEAADFSSAIHNAKNRMPKNVAQIFFGP